MTRVLLIVGVLLALLPATGVALTVDEIARDVRCPTCNTPLNVSEAPIALDMKQYIRDGIESGQTREEIVDGLVAEFGSDVLTTPPKSGFGLIAWVVPAVAVGLGLALVPFLTRLWARRRPRVERPVLTADDEDLLRRERERRENSA